jgi:uracil-DNA glycosylase
MSQPSSLNQQDACAQYLQAMGLGPLWVVRQPAPAPQQAQPEFSEVNVPVLLKFDQGWSHVQLMVVSEAPGAEEDTQGLPFVGSAGCLLDAMLAAIGYNRHSQEPSQQLAFVGPKVVLLLGHFAAQTVLQSQASMGELRGRVHTVDIAGRAVPAVVTYHPAYLLRKPTEKAQAWDDLLLLNRVMASTQVVSG